VRRPDEDRSAVRALLRGLVHSDGCRSIHRFRTKLPSVRVLDEPGCAED
jgi:hypothetical protein